MNGPFQVAQANIAGQSTGKLPARVVKISKPFGEQSVVVPLSYDGSVKADLSAIASEKITLVHIGEKLIILFDNKSTVTLEPFFDSTGKPLDSITLEVSPGRDLTGAEFATLFPVTEDQSVLPAAGEAGNAQASGANFSSVGVDPLALPGPLPLLGQEELPNFVITNLLTPLLIDDTPTAGADALALDEDEISGAGGNPGGVNDIVAPASFTGVLTHNFGADGPGDISFAAMDGKSQVINGITVTFSWDQATHTLLANDGTNDVFKIVVTNPTTGEYETTLLHALHHHTDALADNNETSDTFELTFTVVDGNGTPTDGKLLLEINDDTPEAFDTKPGSFDGPEFFAQVIDDEDQSDGIQAGPGDNGSGKTASGILDIHPGADGLKAVAFTGLDGLPHLVVTADDGSTPVLQAIYVDGSGTGSPENVSLMWTPDGSGGGTLTGTSSHFDGANGHDPVFTLTVDASGNYVYTAFTPLAHPLHTDGADGSTATAWEDNLNLAFTYTVTDGDGDRTSALLTINVDDDVPTVVPTANIPPASIILDESVDANPLDPNTAPQLDDTGVGSPIGSAVIDAGSIAGLFVDHAGADGESAHSFDLALKDGSGNVVSVGATPIATNLSVTDAFNLYPDDSIYLQKVSDAQINGVIAGADGILGNSDDHLAMRFTIDPDTGAVTVEQYLAIRHDVAGSTPADHDDPVSLLVGQAGGIFVSHSLTDGDGDVATTTSQSALSISIEDDGPSVTASANGSFGVTHDETLLLQSPPFGDDNDILFTSVFNGVSNPGHDLDVPFGLPIGYARSSGSALVVGGVDYGTDGPSASHANVFSLTLTDPGDQSVTGPIDSGIQTTSGNSIFLFVENGLIVGRYDGGDAGSDVTNTGSDPAAFAISINPTTGVVSVVQYVSLFHPSPDVGADSDEYVSLADALGNIKATVTVTDGDGDTASASADISDDIRFEDDGPLVTAAVKFGFGVTVDETPGNQNNDVTGSLPVFTNVVNVGHDPDNGGQPLAFATNNTPALAVLSYFGVDGPAPADATVYSLTLNGADADGVPSGLKITDGTTISLFVENVDGNDLIIGRVDGNGTYGGQAAFAIAIDPATGKVSVVEYLSLQHNMDGLNPNDQVALAANTVLATVTIKDGDGDTASASADVSGKIRFNDDGPQLAPGKTVQDFVDEDGLHGAVSDSNPDHSPLLPSETAGTNSATATGSLGVLVNFGADGPGANGFSLKTQAPTDSGLNSQGQDVLIVSSGGTLHGYVEGGIAGSGFGAEDREVFTLIVDASGNYVFILKDQVDHPTLNGIAGDNSENLLSGNGIDLSSFIVATDGDNDPVALAAGTFTIQVYDDIPVVAAKPAETTLETTSYTLDGVPAGHDRFKVLDGVGDKDILLSARTGNVIDEVNTANDIGVGQGQNINGKDNNSAEEYLRIDFVHHGVATGNNTNTTYTATDHYSVNSLTFTVPQVSQGPASLFLQLSSVPVGEDNDSTTANLDNNAFVAISGVTVDGNPAALTSVYAADGTTLIGYLLEGVQADDVIEVTGASSFGRLIIANYDGVTINTGGVNTEVVDGAKSFSVLIAESESLVLKPFEVRHDETISPVLVNDTPDPNDADDTALTLPSLLSTRISGLALTEIGHAVGPASLASLFTFSVGADVPPAVAYQLSTATANGTFSGVDSGLKTTIGNLPILLYSDPTNPQILWGVTGADFASGTKVFAAYADPTGQLWLVQFQAIAHDVDGNTAAAYDDIAFVATNLIHVTANLTDADGDTVAAVSETPIKLSFQDDGPLAVNDIDSANGAALTATGNVITSVDIAVSPDSNVTDGVADKIGTDGAKITQVQGFAGTDTTTDVNHNFVINGQYGMLTLSENGGYTYTRFNGSPVVANDVFTYRLTDGDGDYSTATLTISISDHGVTISGIGATGGDKTVDEDDLSSTRGMGEADGTSPNAAALTQGGTFSFAALDGVDDVSIGGTLVVHDGVVQNLNTPITTTYGVLTITAVDLVGGTVSYSYQLVDNTLAHGPGANGENSVFDSIPVQVTDVDGDPANSSLIVKVVDDVPHAVLDTGSVSEGSLLSVAATGVLFNDTAGADDASINGVRAVGLVPDTTTPVAGGVGTDITGQHGTLHLNADGSYTYQSTANNIASNAVDTFVYTIKDGDGDLSTTTLTINVADVTVTASDTDAVVNEAGLPVIGSAAATDSEIFEGSITPAGGTGPYTYTLTSSANGAYGNLVLNADGTYTYTLDTPYDGTTANNGVTTEQDKDSFSYTVTDAHGNSTTGTILVDITDDVPSITAAADAVSVDEGNLASDRHPVPEPGFVGIPQSNTGFLHITWGADSGADRHLEFAKDSGSNPIGPALTADGIPLEYVIRFPGDSPGNEQIVAYKQGGDPDTDPVFRITLYEGGQGFYTYVQYQNIDHGGDGADPTMFNFTIKAFDGDGDSVSQTLTINVTDDVPSAVADTNSVTEGGIVGGNVLTDGTDDLFGADGATLTVPAGGVVGVRAAGMDLTTPVLTGTGTQIAGAYGKLTLNADGSYSYDGNPNVVPLAGATDVFVYTIKDGDGDTSTTTLTINLTDSGIAAPNDSDVTVYEAALDTSITAPDIAAGTITGSLGTSSPLETDATNQLNATSSAAIVSYELVSGGNAVTVGLYGSIQVAADGSYVYTLTKPFDTNPADDNSTNTEVAESFQYRATDANGNTAIGTITVNIVDDVPSITAAADAVSVDEGNLASDRHPVPEPGLIGTAQSDFGFLHITWGADGGADRHLEFAKDSGSNPIGPALTADGIPLEYVIRFPGDSPGNEQIVAYKQGGDPDTDPVFSITLYEGGQGQYVYVQYQNIDHGGVGADPTTFNFSIKAFDGDGDSVPQTLTVNVTDDVPIAVADADSVVEGADAAGNVLTGVGTTAGIASADTAGADGFGVNAIVGVAAGSNTSLPVSGGVGVAIETALGFLTLNADGGYTYAAKPDATGSNAVDTFVYTIKDGDGDTSTTTLTINVDNVTVVASDTDALVNEAGLPVIGSAAATDSEIFDGSITPSGNGSGPYTYTLTSSATGSYGNLVLHADGTYTYTLTTPYDGATADNGVTTEQDKDSFSYTVTDAHGNSTTGTILVDITDDVPHAVLDTGSVTEGSLLSVAATGVLFNDTAGADGATIDGVRAAGLVPDTTTPVAGGVGADIAGQHGTLHLNADGSYTYQSTANNIASDTTDVFVYTLKDGDGDLSTTTLTINLADVTVTASDTDALVNEAGLPVIGSAAATDSEIFEGSITPAGGTGPYSYTLTSSANGAYGNLVLNPDGTYTYTLTTPYDGTTADNGVTTEQDKDSFSYTVTDAHGNSATGTILVDITDDVPHIDIVNTPNSVNETQTIDGTWTLAAGADGVTSIDVTVGAVTKTLSLAAGSNTVTFGAGDGLTAGTLTVDADLQWHFVANSVASNENVTFSLKATDGDGDISTDSQAITVVNVNQPLAITGSIVGLVEEEHGVPGGIDDISSASLAPNNDQDTAGNLNVTINVFTGTFSPPLSFTGNEGTLSYSLNSVIEGSPVTKAGGGALTSDGAAVLFHVNGGTLTGYVEVSGAGFSGADRTVFTLELNQPAVGQYRFTLLDNLDHHTVAAADNVENIIGINFNNLVKVTDNGDLNDDEPIANFTINVIDDVPVAAIADYAVMSNGAGSPVTFGLDFDNTLANNYGADAAGTVRFPASLDSSSGLTSNGVPITYTVSGDGLTLTAMAGLASVFVVTLNPAAATYSVDMNAVVDSVSTVNFSDGTYQFDGGNTAWVALVPAGQKDSGTPVNDDSRDILITPVGTADTVNNNATSTGAGGGSGGQNIGAGEGLRLDFVIDLTGDTGGSGGYNDNSPPPFPNRDHVFDDHYNTNGATIKFGDGSTNTTLQITARDETVATDANNVVGDGVLDSVNKIIINYDGESEVITFAAIGTTATNFTVGNLGGLGDRTYNVQFVDVDPGAGVKYAAKIIGVLDTNVTIATYTADGYHSLELLNQDGDDFAITGFGAAVQTTAPVSLDVPILVVDGDGDAAASTLGITLVQPGSGIQNHSTDLVGASHTYTSTGANPHIIGSDFADTLNGDGAANVLIGGLGIDSLFGNGGNDILIGGPGADNLTGGLGADIFRLTDTAAADIINDFNNAEGDKVDLTALFSVAAGHSLSEYVAHTGTTLQVDVDGNLNGANFVTVATSLPNTPSAITIMYEDAAHAVQSATV
ncbi:T1SS-143 domain-containing protein [Afipia massiliensis]|uniref:T1SS-143 domain-containing protein n=1 Tax=Afipia massiliensis TaxID=211460 RepID=A0A840N9E9_9BRAD|nr:DUF5801 repeats-in-toxin domain-containing protein [Afipia massiliensis]MBB5055174.1 T1SS-143 domain-containing protein [Afipia massiliensis]